MFFAQLILINILKIIYFKINFSINFGIWFKVYLKFEIYER